MNTYISIILFYIFVGILTLIIDNYFISNFLVSKYQKPLYKNKLEMIAAKIFVVTFWPVWIFKRQKHS
jgi:hypothetical protein